jgi:hypothetical protein
VLIHLALDNACQDFLSLMKENEKTAMLPLVIPRGKADHSILSGSLNNPGHKL